MTTTKESETLAKPEATPNLAIPYLNEVIRPLLGNEIADFWISQAGSWTQRFVKLSQEDTIRKIGEIPEKVVTTDDDATNIVKFNLEHWMLGGNIHVAGYMNLAINSELILRESNNHEKVEQALKSMGGAQARMHWEERHVKIVNELQRIIQYKEENRYDASFQQEQLSKENQHYKSPLAQLKFLQKSQKGYLDTQLSLYKKDRTKFANNIKRVKEESFSNFVRLTKDTLTIFGRDDDGYFDFNFYKWAWTQGGIVEEPSLNGEQPKGVSVVFYRFNEAGEKEFFLCYGKRDGFARTHHLTPTWQTSMSRIEKGNHAGQDYNPTLDSLKDAFHHAGATNGVEISYLDLNANRIEQSPIAVATINWASYSEEQQAQILTILEKENKGLKHAWITEEQLILLGRKGLIDKGGKPSPAINGFLGIAVGRRHPKEIAETNLNRRMSKLIHHLLANYPQEADQLIELSSQLELSPGSQNAGWLLRILMSALTSHKETSDLITASYPHVKPSLPDTTN